MTRISGAAVALCVLALGIGARAQTRGGTGGTPGFTGTWTLERVDSGQAGGRGPGVGLGAQITIKQDPATFVLTRPIGGDPAVATYKLDGSESRNVVAGRGGPLEQVSKATWEGNNKIIITTTLQAGAGQIEQKRMFSIEGDSLIIETTQPGPVGTTRFVYRKK